MKKILCCIPTLGNIRIELALRLYQWKAQYGNFFDIYSSSTRPLYEARNDCVRAFLRSDASYLFFVDSDAVPPSNAIEQLLSHGFDKKIVSGLSHVIKQDTDGSLKKVPLALKRVHKGYEIIDNDLKGLMNVDAVGTICVMIHKSVFTVMDAPWFLNRAEDFYFFENAIKNKICVYLDCNCRVEHYVEMVI